VLSAALLHALFMDAIFLKICCRTRQELSRNVKIIDFVEN
jgi:hypothetical protein